MNVPALIAMRRTVLIIFIIIAIFRGILVDHSYRNIVKNDGAVEITKEMKANLSKEQNSKLDIIAVLSPVPIILAVLVFAFFVDTVGMRIVRKDQQWHLVVASTIAYMIAIWNASSSLALIVQMVKG